MKSLIAVILIVFIFLASHLHAASALTLSKHGITITTCEHDAHAVCSVTWGGKEFIDDYDHGRQLQSAISYDRKGEAWNPTEAGASIFTDGRNPRPSSSVFYAGGIIGEMLVTNIQMAYWNPVAGKKLSNNKVGKYITIPEPGVIEMLIVFSRPAEEKHTFGQYEVLTGYMPAEFGAFYTSDMQPLDDGPGEQNKPVIMCTLSNTHCMGIYLPQAPQAEYAEAGYGRWRHVRDGVVKWNTVLRYDNPAAYHSLKAWVFVGDLATVAAKITEKQNG